MKFSELPPCPFCGSKFKIISNATNYFECSKEEYHLQRGTVWGRILISEIKETDPNINILNVKWGDKQIGLSFKLNRSWCILHGDFSIDSEEILPVEWIFDIENLDKHFDMLRIFI